MENQVKPLFTPNQITVTRFLLVGPLFFWWFSTENVLSRSFICLVFIAIFVADAWDGLVARKYRLGSVFGVYFDPIVDHISYFALCIMLLEAGYLSLWFLFIIITRDLLVVFVKQYAGACNRVISASFLAKVKADLVSVPLACIYLINVVADPYRPFIVIGIGVYLFLFKFIFDPSPEHTRTLRAAIVLLTVVFLLRPDGIPLVDYYEGVYVIMALMATIGSALLYFWKSREMVFTPLKKS